MQLGSDGNFELTYCTNIHPGNGWHEVFANLRKFGPALKSRLSPNAPFGLGLRLSNQEARELLESNSLEELAAFLDEHGLYVSILNGFPYGSFHRQVVKADVFAPDWRDKERLAYTLRLTKILKRLLPAGAEGGISTVPLSYKRWIAPDDAEAWPSIVQNITAVAETMARLRRSENILMHLDIEPEPDGLIENGAEIVDFYQDRLIPVAAPMLAKALEVSLEQARADLLEHVRICFDTCHLAVEYENFDAMLKQFTDAGIKIGRLQISSALKIDLDGDKLRRAGLSADLEPFAESTYLHQVIERRISGELHRYPDLVEALPGIQNREAAEWRIHFHVPLFVEQCGKFGSTQGQIRTAMDLLKRNQFTRHLEIETYTWDVLPPSLKQDLLESIVREYQWVIEAFQA